MNEGTFSVPENKVLVVPNKGISFEEISKIFYPLKSEKTRDWFNAHFYYCLPLVIGNQYGFVLTAQRDFTAVWSGRPEPSAVSITDTLSETPIQNYQAHFGEGILTIQNHWHIRTPPGVNIMTINPPNFIKHGVTHMVGVVETDNLRRDFTFNLKLTKPGEEVFFKKGEPIGAFITVPRGFADGFQLLDATEYLTEDQIDLELETGAEFARLRSGEDVNKPHAAGRLYFKGEDPWGNKFPDHQKH